MGRRAFPLAVGLAASLPIIVATLRGLADGWLPMGDQGIIATRAFDVFSSHGPLLGQYSEASTVTGQPTYSPGPLLYWLLALPSRLETPAALTLTIAVVNVACVCGTVALAERRGGRPLAVITGLAVALMCLSLSSESLHAIFNPSAALFAFLLLFPVCWSIACGDYRLLPLAVLAGSFAAQCHLGYVAPVGGMVVVAVTGLVLRRRQLEGPVGRWVAVAAAVLLLCWAAPIGQQLFDHPGNLGVLAREAFTHQRTQGLTRGSRALLAAVGARPRWLRPPAVDAGRISDMSGGDYGDTRVTDLRRTPSRLRQLSAVLLLLTLLVGAIIAWRRRRHDLAIAAALALVLCAALTAVVAKTPIRATNTLGYMLWWGSVAGMWIWVAAGWIVVSLFEVPARLVRPRTATLATAAGVALVAVAAVAVAATQKPDTHKPYYRPTHTLADGLDRAIPSGTSVKLGQRGGIIVAIEPTIRYTLRLHGVRALGHYASRRPGAFYELDHRPFRWIVSLNGDAPSPYRPARVVVRAVLTDSRGPHPITGTLSPPAARVIPAHRRS